MATLTKNSNSRESEGLRTTSIRPASLLRAQSVLSFVGEETMTDFISNSVDERVQREVKRHKIQLPPDAAFVAGH